MLNMDKFHLSMPNHVVYNGEGADSAPASHFLLFPWERKVLYAHLNTKALLRGDTQARTNLYNIMRQTGVYSVNHVLEFEDMDLLPASEGGDDHHLNGNMITLANARANIPRGAQKGAST